MKKNDVILVGVLIVNKAITQIKETDKKEK